MKKSNRMALTIFVASMLLFVWFLFNPPASKKRQAEQSPALFVTTSPLKTDRHTITIFALGQVTPALETTVRTQVSGEIIKITPEFVPGGRIRKGETILNIDPSDYELNVATSRAQYAQAQADFSLEMGRQTVAKDELALIAQSTGYKIKNTALALRQPQLAQAKANIAIAKAALAKSELDLKRTVIRAPYNALVTSRQANLGDKVSIQDSLARIVNTDKYWITLSLPVENIQWLTFGRNEKTGSVAIIDMDGNRGKRRGHVFKLTGQMDQASRLANILVEVDDPLLINHQQKLSPLILNDYVAVRLIGKTLENVIRIPLKYVRQQDTLWVKRNNQLKIINVKPIFQGDNYILVSPQFSPDDRLITSDIIIPVDGMAIQEANKNA